MPAYPQMQGDNMNKKGPIRQAISHMLENKNTWMSIMY